jgi:Glycosyl transferase family 2
MKSTVVVRSKDEADRLRLTLASLARQEESAEVVVVNDGSSDHTQRVVEDAPSQLRLVYIHNVAPVGRSGAANIGAERASGDVLIFLDGDTLAAADFVRSHMDVHRAGADKVVRGDCFHLRCTRFFLDPETGAPRPGEEDRVGRMGQNELSRSLVTLEQVLEDFGSIERRAQPGIYPGHGPRRIAEMEMDALRGAGPAHVLWMAASGSNQSVARSTFLSSGGYRPDISINEHRELALRLCKMGLGMTACPGRTFHLTHRVGWRNPLLETSWEDVFFASHPIAEVALMSVLWESLSENTALPQRARINSLGDLARAADRCRGLDGRAAIRERHIALSMAESARAEVFTH